MTADFAFKWQLTSDVADCRPLPLAAFHLPSAESKVEKQLRPVGILYTTCARSEYPDCQHVELHVPLSPVAGGGEPILSLSEKQQYL